MHAFENGLIHKLFLHILLDTKKLINMTEETTRSQDNYSIYSSQVFDMKIFLNIMFKLNLVA